MVTVTAAVVLARFTVTLVSIPAAVAVVVAAAAAVLLLLLSLPV
jgi:hypothetical protein